uniref:TNFR-Cys domain-containing protein n=1 Tax=Magallana gigas TaxID=29159 RepID=A0A8W8LTT8_MAGGI|nr:uncharacterized protein LOC117682615 isoform X1 [Crassostrea gigas]
MLLIHAFLLYCTFLSIWTSVVNSCSIGHLERSEDVCCINYVKEENFCKECPIGYFGVDCSVPCDQSFYGKLCSLRCGCLKCHHIYGCVPAKPISEAKPRTQAIQNTTNPNIAKTISEAKLRTQAIQNTTNTNIDQTTERKTIIRQGKQPENMLNPAKKTNLIIISTGVVLTVVLLSFISCTYCKCFTSENLSGNNPESQNVPQMDTVYAEISRRRT